LIRGDFVQLVVICHNGYYCSSIQQEFTHSQACVRFINALICPVVAIWQHHSPLASLWGLHFCFRLRQRKTTSIHETALLTINSHHHGVDLARMTSGSGRLSTSLGQLYYSPAANAARATGSSAIGRIALPGECRIALPCRIFKWTHYVPAIGLVTATQRWPVTPICLCSQALVCATPGASL